MTRTTIDVRRPCRRRLLAALALAAGAAPAAANFHFMSVAEVFGGSPAAPDAQYVVLRMYAAGQNFVAGHALDLYDQDELALGSVVFADDLANGADQARILIATSTAERLFGITADLRLPAALRVAGGKLCFRTVDCFAWGDYAPVDADVGTPFEAGSGLSAGVAARRRLDVCASIGCADDELDGGDDTDDCADDFTAVAPAPVNNAGAVGAVDPDVLFLHGFESGAAAGWSAVVP
jgi:hypothetical protein